MIYTYKIGKNKTLSYNTEVWFDCPVIIELSKTEKFPNRGLDHSEPLKNGKFCTRRIDTVEKGSPEDKIITYRDRRWKVSKKNPPICRCGKDMSWKGYSVWYEYKDPKAKMMSMGAFGNARIGTSKDRRYWTKSFRTRKAREKFIRNFLAKHRG